MITYESAKHVDPHKILESLTIKPYYADAKFHYYAVNREVNELGLRHKKRIEFQLCKSRSESGYYYFYCNEKILYLTEVVALIQSELLNLPTTNAAIDKSLATIHELNS